MFETFSLQLCTSGIKFSITLNVNLKLFARGDESVFDRFRSAIICEVKRITINQNNVLAH